MTRVRDEAFLETAAFLGRRLCRDALWAGDRCNWLGDSMEFVGGDVERGSSRTRARSLWRHQRHRAVSRGAPSADAASRLFRSPPKARSPMRSRAPMISRRLTGSRSTRAGPASPMRRSLPAKPSTNADLIDRGCAMIADAARDVGAEIRHRCVQRAGGRDPGADRSSAPRCGETISCRSRSASAIIC